MSASSFCVFRGILIFLLVHILECLKSTYGYTQPSLYHRRTGVTNTSQIKRPRSIGVEVNKGPHFKLVDPIANHIGLQNFTNMQVIDTRLHQTRTTWTQATLIIPISVVLIKVTHCNNILIWKLIDYKVDNKGPHASLKWV